MIENNYRGGLYAKTIPFPRVPLRGAIISVSFKAEEK